MARLLCRGQQLAEVPLGAQLQFGGVRQQVAVLHLLGVQFDVFDLVADLQRRLDRLGLGDRGTGPIVCDQEVHAVNQLSGTSISNSSSLILRTGRCSPSKWSSPSFGT
jgi:hypothetical protein